MKKIIINILSNIFVDRFTNIAYKNLTHPQLKKLRENEMLTLNKSEKEDFLFKNFNIKIYTWENDKEPILLIHGWEGQAGNFADLIENLIAKGHKVIAFDGPSHGFSSKGSTSLFEFIELTSVLIKKFNVKKLISHSFGSVATVAALYQNKDIEIDKFALLTTPDKFSDRINFVAEQVGISKKVKQKLILRIERENNMKVDTLNISDFVKSINVKQALIIHDKNDGVIPIEQSKSVHKNWKQSTLLEIEGTGHFRILRTESVLQAVCKFLK